MSYISSTNLNLQGDIASYNLVFKNYAIPAAERGTPSLIDGIEWLSMASSLWRANKVEGEIAPQADSIQYRSECLEEMGEALAIASKEEAGLKKLTDKYDPIETWNNTPIQAALDKYTTYDLPANPCKSDYSNAAQHLKTALDLMDNDLQQDTMRLRSLLDKRDEAYNTSAEFMSKINQNIKMAISVLAN